MHFLFFDTETSGLPKNRDYADLTAFDSARLLELAFVVVSPVADHQPITQYQALIKPDFALPTDLPFAIPSLETFQSQGHNIEVVLKTMAQYCHDDTILVGHNVYFDLDIIKSELVRLLSDSGPVTDREELDWPQRFLNWLNYCPALCTMALSTQHLKLATRYGGGHYKWPKLAELYHHCTGSQPEFSHRAMADVITTVVCFYVMWYRGWLPVQLGSASELGMIW